MTRCDRLLQHQQHLRAIADYVMDSLTLAAVAQDVPEEMISAAAPVAPPRERIKYSLDDFDLLATLGTSLCSCIQSELYTIVL